ncbi:hypothetical protein [Microbacterium sp. BH-3-3-3]|uniref:hypothetical protein n=1 Tax=Microbacterium sp. BH-3-3-3 TaxID=1906742 RepID=UPI00119D3CE3|nr:hypothetical protein [Microbacterium sp. BH-3-3-3]
MSDQPSLFDFEEPEQPVEPTTYPMTPDQRVVIGGHFRTLGIVDAPTQFEVVAELIGVRISRVQDLTARQAVTLIGRLESRVAAGGRSATGSSWDQRDHDTWIDRL